MAQTRVSPSFERKKTAQVKQKQTSIDIFCVKNARRSFDLADDEIICSETEKTEEKRSRC